MCNRIKKNTPFSGFPANRVYHNIPLTALNPDNGSALWTCSMGVNDHCFASPALGSDGLVYFGQEFGRVYSLKTSDGSLKEMVETKSGITWSSPAIDHKGVLYITDLSGMVYALQTGSKGLDTLAPWPKFRYDNQNRGEKR